MSPTPPSATSLRVAELSQTGSTPFELRPAKPALEALAKTLGLSGLRKLSFVGTLRPFGNADWELRATLGATVIQPCVVTLDPVTTRIDIKVTRLYLTEYGDIDEPEAEMPEDDTNEPLGAWIDPGMVMQEVLAMAVPEYPRKEEASLDTVRVTEPGKQAMTDEQARPFAGLANLKAQLEDGNDS